MKIVQPTTSEQEILIIPRGILTYSNEEFESRVEFDGGIVASSECVAPALATINAIDMVIKKDGEAIEEILTDVKVVELTNYFKVYFSSTILQEGHSYFIELTKSGTLFYRDKLYVTSQSNFTIKHKQSQNNYTEVVDDNTYIL